MDIFNIIRNRRSIREYRLDPVPEEDLIRILEAGTWAPSAGNLQPWEFIVVRDSSTRRRLSEAAYGQSWVWKAPIVIVVCANIRRTAEIYGERGANLYCLQDTAAAIQNILLTSYYLGYGTCWIGAFNEKRVKEILNIPDHVRPVALITLGKPAEDPDPPPRRPLKSVLHWEKY